MITEIISKISLAIEILFLRPNVRWYAVALLLCWLVMYLSAMQDDVE